jgi:lysophospholipid acyltransferase (LPLAT)-like uncharacterized protein
VIDSLIIALAGLLLRGLAFTWRIEVRNAEQLDALRKARRSFVFALWHGHLLPLLWQHRKEGIALVISEHRDGERIARVARGLGYELVRGSSTRGGGRALIQLSRVLESGKEAAITPDGPRGPARTVAQGVVVAAQRSGAPILPIAVAADRAWRLGSWDSFMIPKPFARVIVAYSTPIYVSDDTAQGALLRSDDVKTGIDAAEKLAVE